MMHIIKQKKRTCLIWGFTVLASMITLTEKIHGMDAVEERYQRLAGEKRELEQKLGQEQEKIQTMENKLKAETGGKENIPVLEQVKQICKNIKEGANTLEDAFNALNERVTDVTGKDLVTKVEVLQEAKKTSEEKQQKAQQEIVRIREATGGSGTNTPTSTRVQKLRKNGETVKTLENLLNVPENWVVSEVEALKETLQVTQEALIQKDVEIQNQITALKIETGEEGGDSPLPIRVRKLSNSLKQDTNLQEAVTTLTETLNPFPGTDCVNKVEHLVKEVEFLKAQLKTTQEIQENMQGIIIDKDEAYNNLQEAYSNLSVKHLITKNKAELLDAELSVEQVAHLKKREALNLLLSKQFNEK